MPSEVLNLTPRLENVSYLVRNLKQRAIRKGRAELPTVYDRNSGGSGKSYYIGFNTSFDDGYINKLFTGNGACRAHRPSVWLQFLI